MSLSPETPRRSFHPPSEPEWHRMIAEAAYYLAQKRKFDGPHALDDWLAAEQQVRHAISPVSRFEKFAATQAAGDGIEGDVLKPGKTLDEKLGANMADRK